MRQDKQDGPPGPDITPPDESGRSDGPLSTNPLTSERQPTLNQPQPVPADAKDQIDVGKSQESDVSRSQGSKESAEVQSPGWPDDPSMPVQQAGANVYNAAAQEYAAAKAKLTKAIGRRGSLQPVARRSRITTGVVAALCAAQS